MEKDDYLSGGKGEEKTACDKEEKIGQLLAELLESERSYVQDLNQVISSLLNKHINKKNKIFSGVCKLC